MRSKRGRRAVVACEATHPGDAGSHTKGRRLDQPRWGGYYLNIDPDRAQLACMDRRRLRPAPLDECNGRAQLPERTMSVARIVLTRMFGRPKGLLGKLGGFIMARMNYQCAAWVIDLLHVQPNDKVLEVGCYPSRYPSPFTDRAVTPKC
jgi:hypothetical protein